MVLWAKLIFELKSGFLLARYKDIWVTSGTFWWRKLVNFGLLQFKSENGTEIKVGQKKIEQTHKNYHF